MSNSSPLWSCVLVIVATGGLASAPADWVQWGGDRRDFHVQSSAPLADSWPSAGPAQLWERNLGEGYSAIAVRGDTLYTMYRRDASAWQLFRSDQEIVVALDARTGRTKWEFAYDVRFRSDQGSGPHVMPQLAGDLVFSVGVTGKLHALHSRTGALVWKRDLYQDLGATRGLFGYSSHPLLYGNKLIIVGGGEGRAVAALEQNSGRIAWAAHSFRHAYSSPVLVNDGGRDQVVVLAAQKILGIDPANGNALWVRSLGTDPGAVFPTTPLWDEQNRILVFAGDAGATALRITGAGAEPAVEHLWSSSRLRSVFSNLLLVGNVIYASRGSYGPGMVTSADIKTGQGRWSTRGFANANFLAADGKVFLLDEDGWLVLARPDAKGNLQILSKAWMLSDNSWTVPTLSGTTLYLRDRNVIMAVHVGAQQSRRIH